MLHFVNYTTNQPTNHKKKHILKQFSSSIILLETMYAKKEEKRKKNFQREIVNIGYHDERAFTWYSRENRNNKKIMNQ